MSGGAGYVLSRGALDKFVNSALTDKVSISSTFYVHIFHTNIILAAFSSYVLALAKKLYKKCARIMLMKLIKGSNWLSCRWWWSWRCGNWKMSSKCQCDSWRFKRWERQTKVFCTCPWPDCRAWIQRPRFLVLEESVLSFWRWRKMLFWHHNCISLHFAWTNVCHGFFHLQAKSFWLWLKFVFWCFVGMGMVSFYCVQILGKNSYSEQITIVSLSSSWKSFYLLTILYTVCPVSTYFYFCNLYF